MGILYTILPTFTTLMEKVIRRIQLTEKDFKSKRNTDAVNFPRKCEKKGLVKSPG